MVKLSPEERATRTAAMLAAARAAQDAGIQSNVDAGNLPRVVDDAIRTTRTVAHDDIYGTTP